MCKYPDFIENEETLEDFLSEPSGRVIETLRAVEGDILFLGVAGKMGPSMARMAKRASDTIGASRRIIGASRFSDAASEDRLNAWGVETIRCDLLDEAQVNALPDVPNVVYMTGMKFGAQSNEAMTWAMNVWLPGMVARRFSSSRIVAFSTGNVYGLYSVGSGGALETDSLRPDGEYAMSCLGRERILEHFSRVQGTPMSILRLNYACELRYGVLVDLAQRVWAGLPVDLGMGHFNVIWQGDANAMSLCALNSVASPARVLNLTGPEILSVKAVCESFGRLMGKKPQFQGEAAPDALLNNAHATLERFGPLRVSADRLIAWIADWVMRGGRSLGKPTHFEVRDGAF